jgi:hypothetical protein
MLVRLDHHPLAIDASQPAAQPGKTGMSGKLGGGDDAQKGDRVPPTQNQVNCHDSSVGQQTTTAKPLRQDRADYGRSAARRRKMKKRETVMVSRV